MGFVMDCIGVNEKGNLSIGGADVKDVAKEYGTPCYVMDENAIRKNIREYKDSIDKCYPEGLVLYASKALSCKRMYEIAKEEGIGVDVVSGGEIYTALKAGFPTEKIYFHGNNKTKDELKFALENNIGRYVVDNIEEMELLNSLAEKMEKKADILFRIKPGIDAHTHSFVMTGQIDSKFGFALETGEAEYAIKYGAKLESLNLVGIHCHIGSQIFELEPFKLAAKVMLNFMADMKEKYGAHLTELDLGGGFGIKYTKKDKPLDYGAYIVAVSETVKGICEEKGLSLPKIIMEPGRSLVGSAGLTVYTVGSVKEIPEVRTYVSVDGGMGDNPRFILYNAEYDAVLVENPEGERNNMVTIVGKCCESGDILIENIKMPEIKAGDLLAVLSTGAYNYSMASNYNRIPRPPVVMVRDGETYLAVKRESYEDLLKNDI